MNFHAHGENKKDGRTRTPGFLLFSGLSASNRKLKFITSNRPMSVSFSSGMTGSDMKHSVMIGSTRLQYPVPGTPLHECAVRRSSTHWPL